MTIAETKIELFTPGDLASAVKLHALCFAPEDNFAMRLGQKFLYATYQFFLDDPKGFGFVVKRNSEVHGVIVGRLDYYVRALNRYRMVQGLKAFLNNPFVLVDKQVFRKTLKGAVSNMFEAKTNRKVKLAPSHEDGKTATVGSLLVHPESRRLKIGDSLLSTAENFCREKNMLKLRAGIRRTNDVSRLAFRSRDYIEDATLGDDLDVLYYLSLQPEVGESLPD